MIAFEWEKGVAEAVRLKHSWIGRGSEYTLLTSIELNTSGTLTISQNRSPFSPAGKTASEAEISLLAGFVV